MTEQNSSFLDYIKCRDLNEVTQFDTVHGLKGDRGCLLTIHHPKTKFQSGIKLNSCSSSEVLNKICELRRKLGDSLYLKFFRIMLCDNGIEFDDMNKLEIDYDTGEIYGKVFIQDLIILVTKDLVREIMNSSATSIRKRKA